jgi:hypothetical protein
VRRFLTKLVCTLAAIVLILPLQLFSTDQKVNAASQPLDLVFLIDTTGSMWDDIANVQSSVSAIVDSLEEKDVDYRLALAEFKDFPVYPYGESYDYPYKANLSFTTEKSQIVHAVNQLYASGGYDWEESVYSGLMGAINAVDLGEWRPEAKKVIMVMGDAPPHDPEPFTGYTLESVIAAANGEAEETLAPLAFSLSTLYQPATSEDSYEGENPQMNPPQYTEPADTIFKSFNTLNSTNTAMNGISIFSIAIGGDWSAQNFYRQLSEGTGGQTFHTPDASGVSEAIFDIIEEIATGDTVPPVSAAELNTPANANGWHNQDVTVTLSATDEGSGVQSTEYSLDGGTNWLTYSEPVTLTEEGIQTINYRSTDNEGNVESAQELVVRIDKTAPEFAVNFDHAAKTFVVKGRDGLSGSDSTDTPITLRNSSRYQTVTIKDKADNKVKIKTTAYKKDKMAVLGVASLEYNSVVATIPYNTVTASWGEVDGVINQFQQTIFVKEGLTLTSLYSGGMTFISGQDSNGTISQVKSGMSIPNLISANSIFDWSVE